MGHGKWGERGQGGLAGGDKGKKGMGSLCARPLEHFFFPSKDAEAAAA